MDFVLASISAAKGYVLVRMVDGTVASARWDDKRNEWSRSPFLI